MSDKKHLSISQINMLGRCGEQYRRRYIEGEKIPPGIAALVGRGVDDSVTINLQNKIDTGDLRAGAAGGPQEHRERRRPDSQDDLGYEEQGNREG